MSWVRIDHEISLLTEKVANKCAKILRGHTQKGELPVDGKPSSCIKLYQQER